MKTLQVFVVVGFAAVVALAGIHAAIYCLFEGLLLGTLLWAFNRWGDKLP